MKKIIHHKVDLLNLPGFYSDATIFSTIRSDGRWTSAEIDIRDCFKKISFEFDFETAGDKKNNLHKVDTLIKHLQQFRKALVKAHKIKPKKTTERKTFEGVTYNVKK